MLLFDGLGDGGLGDVSNVCLPTPKLLDLGGIDVEAGGRESPAREQKGQGQPHVTEPDDAHTRGLFTKPPFESRRRVARGRDLFFRPHDFS